MDEKLYVQKLEELWEKNWPAGVPREIRYPFGEKPITEYLEERARIHPDKVAYIYYGYELTFGDLNDLSSRFASFLASQGFSKGDRVAVFMPNCPQFIIAFYGILKLGCIHVPVNPLFKDQEFIYEMNDAGPELIVSLDLFAPLVMGTMDQTPLKTVLVTSMSEFLPTEPTIPPPGLVRTPKQDVPGAMDLMTTLKAQSPDYPSVNVSLDDTAALNYTGGTTGMPKGCEHTQRDMIYKASAISATLDGAGISPEDPYLTYLPIFWIAGENYGLLVPVFYGQTTIILTRYDPVAVMAAVDRYKVRVTNGLMDNIVEIMDHPDVGKYDLTSLKATMTASFVKKLTIEFRRRWEALTGSVLFEAAWGMTETHTSDTFTIGLQDDDMDLKSSPIFVGLPIPGTKLKIVDFDTKALKPLGEEGEILVKTPALLKAYWNKPGVLESQLDDGWFHTGDIGMLDEDGFLHYLGRNKEMLKVKGMSVFPSEIETLLGRHPDIGGSGVIGREDPEKGQVPVAFIMLKPERKGQITAEELTAWCRENMAVYKVPEIRIMDGLPMTATGKVMKTELEKDL